jgi:hypothetical protein
MIYFIHSYMGRLLSPPNRILFWSHSNLEST